MAKTKIFITRHGVTSWNKEGRMQGQSDIPLHVQAHDEVRVLAHQMREFSPFSALYTSHLTRAIQTGQILQDVLNIRHMLHLEDLSERGYGPYEGRVFQEVLSELATQGLDFHKDTIAGIEPHNDFRKRIVDSFELISSKHPGETVAVVTHGGVLHHLLDHLGKGQSVTQIPNSSLFLYQPEQRLIHQIF